MTTYTIECTAGQESATLELTEGGFFSFPKWECVEGEDVWGTPSEGTCLSPNLTGGQIELSLGTIIADWSTEPGSSGEGVRLDDNGGSFPSGDFRWQMI